MPLNANCLNAEIKKLKKNVVAFCSALMHNGIGSVSIEVIQ